MLHCTHTGLRNKLEEVKLTLTFRRDLPKRKGRRPTEKVMEMSLEQQEPPDVSARQQANKLIRLIRKLRWMGMEEEAERRQAELAQCSAQPTDSVLVESRETD